MAMAAFAFCRLCMSEESLTNIYKLDGGVWINTKIACCINIKIEPDDGLPTLICNFCEQNIRHFYEFKQRCLEIDSKIKNLKYDIQFKEFETEIKLDFIENNLPIDKLNHLPTSGNSEYINKTVNFYDTELKVHSSTTKIDTEIFLNAERSKTSSNFVNVYQCDLCGAMIKRRNPFKRHLLSHSGIKLYSCNICPKKFTRVESQQNHLRSHEGIKPFMCDICGKGSTKKQDLARHMKIHNDEKNYACPNCSKCFKRSSDVHSHLRTHSGIRPYICEVCSKSYTSRSGLRKHYKNHYT